MDRIGGGHPTVKPCLLTVFVLIFLSLPVLAAEENFQYTLRVDGLACPFCAYGIEKQLGKLEGVADVATQIAEGTVEVTMEPGKILIEGDARGAVEDAGFILRGFSPAETSP